MATKYQLDFHPETRKYLDLVEESKLFENAYTSEEALIKQRLDVYPYTKLFKSDFEYEGKREELFVPSKDVEGGIPVYVYTPKQKPRDATILIYFHGGGFVMGDREMVDDTCRILSSQAKCIVVNVEYRLAPEHKFPAMFDDCVAVARWVLANRSSLGGSEKSRVGVSGDSAGGTLTASVAYDVPGLAFQIPVYSFLSANDHNRHTSYKEFAKGPVVTEEALIGIEILTAVKKEDLNSPRFSVHRYEKFDHVPPALFIVAEFDMLTDDSYEYSKILKAAGVESEVLLVKRVVHAFFTLPGVFVEVCRDTYAKVVKFIDKFKPTE